MTKNIILTVLSLGAICASVDLKADFSMDVKMIVLGDGNRILFQTDLAHTILFETDPADDSITVGSIKQQVMDYIKGINPNIGCCMDASFYLTTLAVTGTGQHKIYEDNGYKISRDERNQRRWHKEIMMFIGYTLD